MCLGLAPLDKYIDWRCLWTNYGPYIFTYKNKVTGKRKVCFDVLDVLHFAQILIMVFKSRYFRRLDFQHTRRM